MNNWKQMFAKLAEQKGLEFQQEEKKQQFFLDWLFLRKREFNGLRSF